MTHNSPYTQFGSDLFKNIPAGPYNVVLMDPPWYYPGQQDKWGAAAKFYPTTSFDQLTTLPVRGLLDKKSVVFCWTTGPKLEESVLLFHAWGLHYRGVAFVWVKTKLDGTPVGAQGVRPSIVKPLTEFVLVASTVPEGRPIPLADESIVQTVFAPKGEHSVKPEAVQNRIEAMYPSARKLEMFARRSRPGWDTWGNEVENGQDEM